MAPETMKGKSNRHADIWYFGGIAVFCITKEFPYLKEDENGESIWNLIETKRWPESLSKAKYYLPEVYDLVKKCYDF